MTALLKPGDNDRDRGIGKRITSQFVARKALFTSQKNSDLWHQQIDFTAGTLRPNNPRFPWSFLKKHTDLYLKKKGKLTQQDVDIRLQLMIADHEARDVAVAACAHALSPRAVRALLNVDLNVGATFYGLEMYLQCLIAASVCNPQSVTTLEAHWAAKLLSYATHGAGAAGRYLEGLCHLLMATAIPDMSVVPDFSILARRAFEEYGTQLEGFRLRCQWMTAYNAVSWMLTLAQDAPPATPPGHLLPEHILDSRFPVWRLWAKWRPNLNRIMALDSLNSTQRGVLPDMLSLEGPDFITGRRTNLRDGIIVQYAETKPLVRFKSLVIDTPSCTKDELKRLLYRTATLLETALKAGSAAFDFYVQLTIARPIRKESLDLLDAMSKIKPTPPFPIYEVILHLYGNQTGIGGDHVSSLCHIIPVLDYACADDLRKVLLRPWLVQGIEKCIADCQDVVRMHITTGLRWANFALELHSFCQFLKSSVNILPLLGSSIRAQLDALPELLELNTVLEIYDQAGANTALSNRSASILASAAESYCIDSLTQRKPIRSNRKLIDAMICVWHTTTSAERRQWGIIICRELSDVNVICQSLSHIASIDHALVMQSLAIMACAATEPEQGTIQLTTLLSNSRDGDAVACFKPILYDMLDKQADHLIDYTLSHFKSWEWFQWMLDLNSVFAETIVNTKIFVPSPLKLSTHMWAQQLSEFMPTITRLEEFLIDKRSAVHCILRGGLWEQDLLRILEALTNASEQPAEQLMQTLAGRLTRGGQNASSVADCLKALLGTDHDGLEACNRIIGSFQDDKVPLAVTEIVVAGWIQDEDLLENDKDAVRALACLLNLEIYEYGVPDDKLEAAGEYYQELEKELVKEADRLEGITMALKARDPIGTGLLLEQLGLEDFNYLKEEISMLPVGVIDAVEQKGRNEVEISFPFTSFTSLECAGMGIGQAKTLLLRLFLDYTCDMPIAFCTHLDTELDTQVDDSDHRPWICLGDAREPDAQLCHGKATPLTWQLNRILHRYFKGNSSDVKIEVIHTFVKRRLEDMAHACVVCGATHNVRHTTLRRSIPCQSISCISVWNKTPLEVRLPEIYSDPFVVDMLLTAVYAAAMSGRADLLPGCPITSTQTVIAILNNLPSIQSLQASPSLSTTLLNADRDAERLLTWACTQYRGFIASANGICRIPGWSAGTHQFILANASPALESGFASKLSRFNTSTRVLFHGTSLDRLPSILAQGLRICSGTHLQRTGAAHGRGIYLAEEPATSFGYSPTAISWRNSGLNNMRLLLGCEVVGDGNRVSSGIHVLKDEKSVIVRYVFLLTPGVHTPGSNVIGMPMASAMAALRAGSV